MLDDAQQQNICMNIITHAPLKSTLNMYILSNLAQAKEGYKAKTIVTHISRPITQTALITHTHNTLVNVIIYTLLLLLPHEIESILYIFQCVSKFFFFLSTLIHVTDQY